METLEGEGVLIGLGNYRRRDIVVGYGALTRLTIIKTSALMLLSGFYVETRYPWNKEL